MLLRHRLILSLAVTGFRDSWRIMKKLLSLLLRHIPAYYDATAAGSARPPWTANEGQMRRPDHSPYLLALARTFEFPTRN